MSRSVQPPGDPGPTERPVLQGAVAGFAAVATVLAVLALFGPSRENPGVEPPYEDPGTTIPASAILHPEIHSVGAAVAAGQGWLVLDPRGGQVHRLDARGGHLLSFGRPGSGPGELAGAAGLALAGDTVLVVERAGDRLHRFTLAGDHLDTRRIRTSECPAGGVVGATMMGDTPLLLFRCLDPARRGSFAAVYALEPSLRLLARLPLHADESQPVSPFLMPVLAGGPGGFLLGATTEPCLGIHDREGVRQGSACHPWPEPVPLPSPERARLETMKNRLGSGVGQRLEIPPVLPPFDRVFAPRGRPIFLTVTGWEERVLDVLEDDGLRRLPLPASSRTFVGRDAVLVAWEDVHGTWIRVYPFPA